VLGNIVMGGIAGLIGGFLFDPRGVSAGGLIGYLIMAVVGAAALLFVVGLFRKVALDGFQVGGPIGPARPYRYPGISRASHCFIHIREASLPYREQGRIS
jgi:hypothetical protein